MRRVTAYLFQYGLTPKMHADPDAILRRAERLEARIARDQKTLDYLLTRWHELARLTTSA